MQVLVTGAAGFIGSSVSLRLLEQGHSVLGVDSFVDYYPRQLKEQNLAPLRDHARFRFIEADLGTVSAETLREWLVEYPLVSHQAAQAGVRSSWGKEFEVYTHSNILATQRLLEAARLAWVQRLVYASSSSVYGQASEFPLKETGPALPVSPYGVSKLAAEHLARLYFVNYQVPTVSLRYFTVYGPRQRPDMAFHRLCRSALTGEPFPMYGGGTQSRNFTYIDDVVDANIAALTTDLSGKPPFLGEPINIGGGARVSLREAIELVEQLANTKLNIKQEGFQKGDVDRTEADLTRATAWLNYRPRTDLRTGLAAELAWAAELYQI